MGYDAQHDPLCYPGTIVLKNKAGLRDQAELDKFELPMSLIRAKEMWPPGKLDYPHYRALHRHLFQDVYEWAGEVRTVRIAKGGSWFCFPEYIDQEMNRAFSWLENEDFLANTDRIEFAAKAARLLADLNAIHPFREGNGRTQLALLSILVDTAEFKFDVSKLQPAKVLNAMVQSFSGDEGPLGAIILGLISLPSEK